MLALRVDDRQHRARVVLALLGLLGCAGRAQPSTESGAEEKPRPSSAPLAPSASPPPSPAASASRASDPVAESPALAPTTLPDLSRTEIPGALAIPDDLEAGLLPRGRRLGPDAPIAAPWLAVLAAGASSTFHPAAIELQGVVLDGEIELRDDAARGAPPRRLSAWHAFRAPGAAITLAETAKQPARVVLFALSADGSPLSRHVPAEGAPPARRRPAVAPPRKAPLTVVDLATRQDLRWGRGRVSVRLAWDPRSAPAALDLLLIAPDTEVAEHTHPGAWECLLPLRAEGDLVTRGSALETVRAGEAVCVVPDEPHAWVPLGTEPLWAVQFYVPAGPEQRFHGLAAEERAGTAHGTGANSAR